MREIGQIEAASRNHKKHSIGAFPEQLPQAVEMAAYAAEVKKLTNYEVWRNVESALITLAPEQEPESIPWRHLRTLLDELKWRLSGLEGSGFAPNRLPEDIRPH